MATENYSRDYDKTELVDKYCSEEDKSDAFKAGVLDGIEGTIRRRKKTPASDFDIELVDSRIRVSGTKTYNYRERLKELGGRWNNKERCWELPKDQMQEMKSDKVLGSAFPAGASKAYSEWIADYNEGKEWFNQHGSDILKSSPKR